MMIITMVEMIHMDTIIDHHGEVPIMNVHDMHNRCKLVVGVGGCHYSEGEEGEVLVVEDIIEDHDGMIIMMMIPHDGHVIREMIIIVVVRVRIIVRVQ